MFNQSYTPHQDYISKENLNFIRVNQLILNCQSLTPDEKQCLTIAVSKSQIQKLIDNTMTEGLKSLQNSYKLQK